MKLYAGPLYPDDPAKMPKAARNAYNIWRDQGRRNTRAYSSREFIAWWLKNLRRKTWVRPSCGRIDHAKGYSFSNIVMQELAENVQERNQRVGLPRVVKSVASFCSTTGKMLKRFESQGAAAEFYGVSRKTVYNHCQGVTTHHFRFGPGAGKKVTFRWS